MQEEGAQSRTQQEGLRPSLKGRFDFQSLGLLNIVLLDVFSFPFAGWYLPLFPGHLKDIPSRAKRKDMASRPERKDIHSIKSKEVMEQL